MPKERSTGVVLLAALLIVIGMGRLCSVIGLVQYQQPKVLTEESFMRTFSSPKMSQAEREEFLRSDNGQKMLQAWNRLMESRLFDKQVFMYGALMELLLGSLLMAMGIGLINLKEWARRLTVYYHLLIVPLDLFVYDSYFYKVWQVIANVLGLEQLEGYLVGILAVKTCLCIVIAFLIAFFFTRDKIKAQFERGPNAAEQVTQEGCPGVSGSQ